jgi:ABC-type spermidine/putrescine transport system permease subunit II
VIAPLAVIDWDALLEVIWVSLVAGIGVTAAFAAGLLGTTRYVDLNRSGRGGEAALFGLLGLAGVVIFLGAVVFGIVVMTHK